MVAMKNENSESQFIKSDIAKPTTFERVSLEYEDYSSRFYEKKMDFAKQFAHVYARRLGELRHVLEKKSEAIWASVPIVKLADLELQENKRCVIIGTLYKHQQWKPSILREFSDDGDEIVVEAKDDYCDDKDQPYLEDEMLRIKLVGNNVNIGEIVTGVVCGVLGHKTDSGTFDVEEWCLPGCPAKLPVKASSSKGKLVLISGLDLTNNGNSLSLNLLNEWISGMAGNLASQADQAAIVRIVIAGDAVSSIPNTKNDQDLLTNEGDDQETIARTAEGIAKLDEWLGETLEHCCVTLMPGPHDPTNYMLPQKPMHRFMFKKSFRYRNFQGASNPWAGRIGGRMILGTSGQPIEDIIKVCGTRSTLTPLGWLEKTLIWRHLCPTAPDTVPCHPYCEKDLFIINECPDIYFVSNTNRFETKLWMGEEKNQVARLICVPRFSTTKTAVLVDLETLDTETIAFGTS